MGPAPNEERSEATSSNEMRDAILENTFTNEENKSDERAVETIEENEMIDDLREQDKVTEVDGSSQANNGVEGSIDDENVEREQTEHSADNFVTNDDEVYEENVSSQRGVGTGDANETLNEYEDTTGSEVSIHIDDVARGSVHFQKIEREIKEEFPEDFETIQVPTLKELIHVGEKPATRYKQGDWVEIRGPDMVWRLDMLTRVVKSAPDDWDWNDPNNEGKEPEWIFRYHAGNKRDIKKIDLRSPEEGLKRLFGNRPWVWQQWACLKLENALRFQLGHENDFMTMDVQKYAAELWEDWLNHPSNADFKKVFDDERIGDFGRSELVHHIMKPFELIDSIKEDKERWDFAGDKNMSVYTYLSILGSGWLVPLIMAAIQITIPILLLRTSELSNKDFSNAFRVRFPADEDKDDLDNVQGIVITVLILYLFRVVPETIVSFFRAVGPSSSAYSRIMSLREKLWLQQEDRFGQMIGYKADIFMNTLFVCFMYGVNIYIIANTTDALDVILNALAFEFVLKLDEEVVTSSWWDPRRRWLTAGSIEIVIQYTLQKKVLRSTKSFWEEYDIPVGRKSLVESDIGGENFLYDTSCAAKDSTDTRFMTKEEKKSFDYAYVAETKGLKHATSEYKKSVVHFDRGYNFIATVLFAAGDGGMFNRYRNYRTWSRWERVLFIADIPEMSSVFAADGTSFSDELDQVEHSDEKGFANFSPIPDDGNIRTTIFLRRAFDILTLKYIFDEIKRSWEERDYFRLFFNPIADSTLWLAYVVQIIFPFYFLAVFVAVSLDVIVDKSDGKR